MNDRAQAIAILKQARDLLAQRLAERILESRQEILDDAEGYTYGGEIDSIYDQVAMRLSHVNTMLSNLPPQVDEQPPGGPSTSAPRSLEFKPRPAPGIFQADTSEAPETSGTHESTGLVVESAELPYETAATSLPVTFEMFGRQIAAGDVESAGRSLSVLFAVDEARGSLCAVTFHQQLRESPEVMAKAMRLRHELQAGSMNSALMLLWECFGLQGIESIAVLQTLKARLVGHNEAL